MSPIRPLLAVLLSVALAGPAQAFGDPNDPNWPCVQRKVLELSPAATWTGPVFDPATTTWRDKPEVVQMVRYLAQRRVTLDEAAAAIKDFAAETGEARADTLTALYAGLFATLNGERKDVIAGISRFAKKQKSMADLIKESQADLDRMRADPKVEYAALQTKTDEVLWETRVFEERQKSLVYVCEVPVIIEQRLFALGRAIAEQTQ